MSTWSFWKQALERAVKTFAQVLLAAATATAGLGLEDVGWPEALSVAGLAALASLLTSIVSLPAGEGDSPSLVSVGDVNSQA